MRYENGYALIVGIANYMNTNALPQAVLNDAHDLARLLTSEEHAAFPFENVTLLCDADATRSAIRTALSDLALRTRPDDLVIVYFSGHGIRTTSHTSAILPFDFVQGEFETTAIGEADLSAALARIGAGRLVVILDACHSGGGGQVGDRAAGLDDLTVDRLAEKSGRVVIASSRVSETSIVREGDRNSVFTAGLLEALSSAATRNDGMARVFDVFQHVSRYVQQQTSGRQHPIFKASDLESNFAISASRRSSKDKDASEDFDAWPALQAAMNELYPSGPLDEEIWSRAGGDVAALRISGSGRSMWFGAMKKLRLGGGGDRITPASLVATALADFPRHEGLLSMKR
ncbi:caspase family protein [Rhizobium leguminosarum]|uniref:caspase family protein n=1 Tax=Rhizobium leguminosarum TaxID=384 RepID=UPI001C96A0C9|nr:caspase family protein [Rhizobium leguminosarum]MBY5399464.1 caspase family protein [Rhizobium leguminosarum]